MDVTPNGRVMETSDPQERKASSMMDVTPEGKSTWPFASGVTAQPARARGSSARSSHAPHARPIEPHAGLPALALVGRPCFIAGAIATARLHTGPHFVPHSGRPRAGQGARGRPAAESGRRGTATARGGEAQGGPRRDRTGGGAVCVPCAAAGLLACPPGGPKGQRVRRRAISGPVQCAGGFLAPAVVAAPNAARRLSIMWHALAHAAAGGTAQCTRPADGGGCGGAFGTHSSEARCRTARGEAPGERGAHDSWVGTAADEIAASEAVSHSVVVVNF